MKHILIIGGRDHTIHRIKKLGINYTLFQVPELTTEKQIKSSKRLIVGNYENTNEVLSLAKTIHQFDKFDAVASFAEYGMYTAAICGEALNLPSNDIKPVEYTRDKIKMRRLLEEHNLGTVRYQICENIADVKNFFKIMKNQKLLLNLFQVEEVAVFH